MTKDKWLSVTEVARQAHLKDAAVHTYLEEFAEFIPRLDCDDVIRISSEAVNIIKVIADLQKEGQDLAEISVILEGKSDMTFESAEESALIYINLGNSLISLVNKQAEALRQMVELYHSLAFVLSRTGNFIKYLTTSGQAKAAAPHK
jgi:hypothetical protein